MVIFINFGWKLSHGKKQLILFLFEPKHWGPPSLVGPNWMWTLRTFVVEWFLSCVGWCPDSVEWFQPWNLQLNNLSLTRKWMDMAMSWWAPYSASLFAYSLIDLTFVEVSGRISSVFHHVFQIRIQYLLQSVYTIIPWHLGRLVTFASFLSKNLERWILLMVQKSQTTTWDV